MLFVETERILKELNCFVYSGSDVDGKWVVHYIGKAIEKFTGLAIEEFIEGEKDWLELIHPDDKERVLDECRILYDPPQSVVHEYRIVHKNGDVYWIRDSKKSTCINGWFQVTGIVVDITRKKLAEDKNKELLDKVLAKNKLLNDVIKSTQILNTQVLNENKLIKESIKLEIERDLMPVLDSIEGHEEHISLLKMKLNSILSDSTPSDISQMLTKKEQEISSLIKVGLTQTEVADKLDLGVNTVKTHVKNIKKKFMISKEDTLYSYLSRL